MRCHRAARATLLILIAGSAVAAGGAGVPIGQDPRRDTLAERKSGTAVIAGIVRLDDPQARPPRRVLVTLVGGASGRLLQEVTDDAGRFAFADLPGGRYTLTAEKPAYVKAYYGSKRPGAPPAMPIALADGERLMTVAMSLMRGAAIEGRLLDENGLPLASGQVRAQQPDFVSGARKLVDPLGSLQLATTDERGWYRLYGLPPGEYTVMAVGGGAVGGGEIRVTTQAEISAALRELQGGSSTTAAGGAGVAQADPPAISRGIVYFPSAAEAAGAQTFTLAKGEERTGVDMVSPLVRTSRIDGIALGVDGQPLKDMSVGMANLSRGSLYSSPGFVRPDANGRFSVRGLAPGRYLFFGRSGAGVSPSAWTETEVAVFGQDVSNVVLQFQPGLTVSGRIAFEGAAPPPNFSSMHVALTAIPVVPGAAMNPPAGVIRADGSFTIAEVPAGKYRLAALSVSGAWTVRSAVVNGRDLLDAPLEVTTFLELSGVVVTFTDHPTEISGTLFDALNRPTPEYSVVVFTTNRALWATAPRRMSGAVKLGSDGKFRVTGLPPGEYYLSAVTEATPSQLNDPAFLEQLAQAAVKITLAEGEKKVQDLKLGGG